MKLEFKRLSDRALILLGLFWGVLVVAGLLWLFHYQTQASSTGKPVTRWPGERRWDGDGDQDQSLFADADGSGRSPNLRLVMIAHPRCACTRSSLEALARLMSRSQGRVTASVLFLKPASVDAGWAHTDLWDSAAAIPGVQVVADDAGREAARFGVQTSGHVLLFDRAGRRLFSGGITAGRGHHGDNAGLSHCLALLSGEVTQPRDMPVFGCALLEPSRRTPSHNPIGEPGCVSPRTRSESMLSGG